MRTERQIFLRAFWGFSPETEGYYGFTNEGDRVRFLAHVYPGDWVIIYGAIHEETEQTQQGHALGILELSGEICTDEDRMSNEAIEVRRNGPYRDRWTFGITVRRAWRFSNRVKVKHLAPSAMKNINRFERSKVGILLLESEKKFALSQSMYEVSVFGEPSVQKSLNTTALEMYKPSIGLPPSFGIRNYEVVDKKTAVYLMRFTAPASVLMGQKSIYLGAQLFKVGRSNDTKSRLAELNSGFPPSAESRWSLMTEKMLADAATADSIEIALKAEFDKNLRSVGGEFFVGDQKNAERCFLRVVASMTPVIIGATNR